MIRLKIQRLTSEF